MPKISFHDVSVTFDAHHVLDPLNLSITEQRVGIIGSNGSGKSTLIRLINGLGSPTTGSVLVDDLNVSTHGREVRRKVGFVFSDAENQIVMPTVQEDIAFSLRRLKLPKEEKRRRVAHAMEYYGLDKHADHSPHMLSGGQKQMLALAAVTVIEPEVIIADEPTTLLDMRNRNKIRKVFARLPQQLIVVTHDLDFIDDFDRVICINEHKIVADGDPKETIAFYRELMEKAALEDD